MKKPLSRAMEVTLWSLVVSNSLYLTETDLGNFVILFYFRLQMLSFSHKFLTFSLSISKLSFYNLFTIIWLSILSSTVGYISTKYRLFMSISGPSESGKTYLVFQMLVLSTRAGSKVLFHCITKYFNFIFTTNSNIVPLFLNVNLKLN